MMSTSEAEPPVAEALTADQRRLLQLVFDHFSRTAEWPIISRLQRDLVRNGDSLDLDPLTSQIPVELGFRVPSGSANSFQLTIRGVVMLAPESQEVADFETAMRLCCELYLVEDDKPMLTSARLRDQEGMDELRLRKLEILLQMDSFLTASGGGTDADHSWYQYVSDRCHRFRGARTAADYLAICEQIHAQAAVTPRPTVPPVGRRLRRPAQLRAPGSVDLVAVVDALHPRIRDACLQLVVDGHLRAAVLDACIALRDLLREKSGLDLEGEPLVTAALSFNKDRGPKVTVDDLLTETGQNLQRGTMLIAQGVVASIRNVLAHNVVEPTSSEALGMLGTISLIAGRIAETGTTAADSLGERRGSEP